MFIKVLRAKLHRVTLTDKNIKYSGSIAIDPDLLDKVGLLEHEAVLVVNVNNGTRHETYVLRGQRGSSQIILNGAAARLGEVGDLLIIMSFAYVTPEEARDLEARIGLVDERNRFTGYLEKRDC